MGAGSLTDLFEAGPPDQSVDDFVAAEPAVAEHVRMREVVVTSLVAELRSAIETPISYQYMGDYPHGAIDRAAIEGIINYVHLLCYGDDPVAAGRLARETAKTMTDGATLICGLEGHHPLDSAETMHAFLKTVYENGVRCRRAAGVTARRMVADSTSLSFRLGCM